MRFAWITDPHLNHVPVFRWDVWVDRIGQLNVDAVLVTGDISEGDDVLFQLNRLAAAVSLPIYFVLGNHDFYEGSIAGVRQRIIGGCRDNDRLIYLTDVDAIDLGRDRYLIGEDGWGDATIGDAMRSPIELHDFRLIDDFADLDRTQRTARLNTLGRESADRLIDKLHRLPAAAVEVWVATHVPPYRESCWYEGRTTDDTWAPYFVSGCVGEALRDFASSRPDCRFTVVCGHTHHGGLAKILPNLVVHTGCSQYAYPGVEAIIDFDSQSSGVSLVPADVKPSLGGPPAQSLGGPPAQSLGGPPARPRRP